MGKITVEQNKIRSKTPFSECGEVWGPLVPDDERIPKTDSSYCFRKVAGVEPRQEAHPNYDVDIYRQLGRQ